MAGHWTRTQSKQSWYEHTAKTSIEEREASGYRNKTVKWPQDQWLTATITMLPSGDWTWVLKNFDFCQKILGQGECKTEGGCKAAVKREVKKICAKRGVTL